MGEARVKAAAWLAEVLRDPARAASLDAPGWTALLTVARAETLIGTLAFRLVGQAVPTAVAAILADARGMAAMQRETALWEAEMARRALARLDVPVLLLKGTAFAAAGLSAAEGRTIGDLDILVAKDALPQVEAALLVAGWEWVKPDPYDDLYYRTWMHELPPLIHRERDRMIDVHHTILPPTAGPKPDADALIRSAVALPDGILIPHPADLIVHAAAHLFADGDLTGGLRNLWDIDRLVRDFSQRRSDFAAELGEHSRRHDLVPAVARGLRLSHMIYGTPLDRGLAGRPRLSDRLFRRRLLARDGWGRGRYPLMRLAFYVRSHWLRMPPLLLARHLWTKWRKGKA